MLKYGVEYLKLEDAVTLGEQLAHDRSSLMSLSVEKDKEIVNLKLKLEKYELIVKQFSQRVKKLKHVIRKLNDDDRYVAYSEAPHRQRLRKKIAQSISKSESKTKLIEAKDDKESENEGDDNDDDEVYNSDFDELNYNVNSELLN